MEANMTNFLAEASSIFNSKFRVQFGFDGTHSSTLNGPGEVRRAAGWGADSTQFTWKRFVTLEDAYNPYPNQLNPWSLKKWYLWGCRKFHFHCPFGRVAEGRNQGMVYEVDQYLTAKNGLTVGGQVQNTACHWMVCDFVVVIKALTTGKKGALDAATWNAWTTGPDAWFNPSEPIDLIVYVGGMADPAVSDAAFGAYIDRWEALFKANPAAGLNRLKASVAPLISANCKIGFDASVASPGSVPGANVSLAAQNIELQKGWWTFWKWVETKIGKQRMYVESHPFKKDGFSNPYLGYNVIADDDWSYSKCCPAQPEGGSGAHMTSEMGEAEFWRCIWQNAGNRTPLISTTTGDVTVAERYAFLETKSITSFPCEFNNSTELRLTTATCCEANHNYYWGDLWADIIVYHLLDKQHIRGETNPEGNNTKSGIMVGTSLLQILPSAFVGDPRYDRQFGVLFKTKDSFIQHLAEKMALR